MLYKYKIINKDDSTNVILYIKNFLNDYYLEENYYITFTNKINKINDNHIILTGTKNDIDKDGYKKLHIDNIYMEIEYICCALSHLYTYYNIYHDTYHNKNNM